MTKRRRGIFKSRRAAIAAKTRDQTSSGHYSIPATIDPATKAEVIPKPHNQTLQDETPSTRGGLIPWIKNDEWIEERWSRY